MRATLLLIGTVLFGCGMAAGIALTGHLPTQSESEARTAPLSVRPAVVPTQAAVQPGLAAGYPDFSVVAGAAVAAVTNISAQQVRQPRFGNDRIFQYFFGDFFGDSPDLFGYPERPNLGSGVIVDAGGYVLTNAHVLGRQTGRITVTLSDNRSYLAELIGRDESTDIAVLKIDAERLPTVPWGDSSLLRVAEWVLAIGNPFELNQTVTLGIVSAVGRDNLGIARYEDFIQTDAAINPGNSGGALINARGELVGINTVIFSRSGGSQGVGFAVPSNVAHRVMRDLIEYGEVRRGSFGYVDVRKLTPELARELGVPDTRGVVIWRMHHASAAARAGLEPGDVIVTFDNEPVEDPSDYARLLSDAAIGRTVSLTVYREGRRVSFDVEVSQARAR